METKELKAIDGNEKKKIVKLNQSSILPGSVRIKVNTLVGEMLPQDEVLPEIVINEEIEEAEEMENAIAALDIEGKSKEELAAMLEEIVQEADVAKIKDQVTAIRVRFMKLNKEDLDKEMEAFLEGGGDKESYQHVMDDAEKRFNAAFGIFKANRARQNELMDAQKLENLAQKQAILEELKQLIASEETLKKTYDDFRALQEKWKNIGQVPATENANLWNTYHFLVEKFFDKVNINRELRDLDMKKNLDAKISLCERAEELLAEELGSINAWQKKSTEFSELFKVWRTVGPAAKKQNEEIWARFKGAMDAFFAKKKEFFASLKDRQSENLERKINLCIEAEALQESTEWKKATEQFKRIQSGRPSARCRNAMPTRSGNVSVPLATPSSTARPNISEASRKRKLPIWPPSKPSLRKSRTMNSSPAVMRTWKPSRPSRSAGLRSVTFR